MGGHGDRRHFGERREIGKGFLSAPSTSADPWLEIDYFARAKKCGFPGAERISVSFEEQSA
jgi:hypothetical protein